MAIANNIEVEHQASQSSKKIILPNILEKNYMYGEFLFDLKLNKLRFLKILRKFHQNLILFFFNLLIFRFNNSLDNFSKLTGIIKFIIYFISRKKNNMKKFLDLGMQPLANSYVTLSNLQKKEKI